MLGNMRLIDGWRGAMPPMTLMALPFDVEPLRVKVCFFGAIDAMEEALRKGFGMDEREILSVNLDLTENISL